MKTLYFDLSGCVLVKGYKNVKPYLANGAFEKAIREVGFEKLICYGRFAEMAHMVSEVSDEYDPLGMLYRMCQGAFNDEPWFRAVTTVIADSKNSTSTIDLAGDWWVLDSLVEEFFLGPDQEGLLETHRGGRIFIPGPLGDGRDVIEWLRMTQ
jgi:hypothetical protein